MLQAIEELRLYVVVQQVLNTLQTAHDVNNDRTISQSSDAPQVPADNLPTDHQQPLNPDSVQPPTNHDAPLIRDKSQSSFEVASRPCLVCHRLGRCHYLAMLLLLWSYSDSATPTYSSRMMQLVDSLLDSCVGNGRQLLKVEVGQLRRQLESIRVYARNCCCCRCQRRLASVHKTEN